MPENFQVCHSSFPPTTVLDVCQLVNNRPAGDLSLLYVGCLGFWRRVVQTMEENWGWSPNGLPLPPGPKGYPVIGNLFDMPIYKPWVVYDGWRKTYGKTFMINLVCRHCRLDKY